MIGALHKPRFVPRTGDDSPARSVFGYVWRMSGWRQVCVCLLAALVAGLSVAPLELQKRLVNDALPPGDVDLLVGLGALYLAVVIAQSLLKFALRLYQGWLSESAIRSTRSHLAGLRAGSQGDERDGSQGREVSIIGTEVDKLGGFVGESLAEPAANGGMVIAILTYMLVVEPVVAGVCLLFLIPQMVLAPVIQRHLNGLIERRIELVRAMGDSIATSAAPEQLDRDICAVFFNRMRIYRLKFLLKGLIGLLNNFAPLSVLLFGGWLVIQGTSSLGVVVAFMSGFDRLADPLRELIAYYRTASRAGVQHTMIAKWM